MSLTKRQREIEAANRAEAGLPVHRCPSCGEIGRHYEAESLDEHDVGVPGYFTCAPPSTPGAPSELDLGVDPLWLTPEAEWSPIGDGEVTP